MDFDDTPKDAAFRARARAWIQANAPREHDVELKLAGDGMFSIRQGDPLAAARRWQRRKADAGWAAIHWPKQYGGADASPIERVIWAEEEGPYAKLSSLFGAGLGMCGPTLMAWASEAQKRELVPRISRGDDIWCQLFSEPAAGSDLAGVRMRAVQDGDAWVVNGQKIWTSMAHAADWGLLLARSDSGVAKHSGLTMFFVDMRSPGIDVRPIRQIDDESYFNEVFFSDVRIPDAQRLGEAGRGWAVALTTLMNERAAIAANLSTGFPELVALCGNLDAGIGGKAIDDPRVRSRLASFAVRHFGLKYTAFRSISALARGEQPGPENSIGKLVAAPMMQEIARFALELEGEAGLLSGPEVGLDRARFQSLAMRSPSARIKGGTDQILRNIIAERVLGLPADFRADRDLPFDQIPTAASL
jgi:acyl-CoA dehydrogenase